MTAAGCGQTGPPPNAEPVARDLKAEALPIHKLEAYTEDNDPNKLMGRSGQYVDKVNVRDRRTENDRLS